MPFGSSGGGLEADSRLADCNTHDKCEVRVTSGKIANGENKPSPPGQELGWAEGVSKRKELAEGSFAWPETR